MATRGLVESSIDAFWSAAAAAQPTLPQDVLRRSQPARKLAHGTKSGYNSKSSRVNGAGTSGSLSARRAAPDPEAHAEFHNITVELSGREGYNSIAVNGIWRFWRVRCGRLAFLRDVEMPMVEDYCSDPSTAVASADVQAAGSRPGVATIRLYLFYLQQVDSWIISDTPDSSGSITADCGPVGNGNDLDNHWRIWDGGRWCEDRNVVAEVALGGPGFPNLKGLRVMQLPPVKQRAMSQEPRTAVPRAPSSERPQDSARPRRHPRPTDKPAAVLL